MRHHHWHHVPLVHHPQGVFVHDAVSTLGGIVVIALAVLLAAVAFVVAGRVWGRHRLAAAGSWFEVRFGEQTSRRAFEAFLRTLAQGLPRRWFGARPWVGLSLWAEEDRATYGLFVSGGLSCAQVRAALEQALGGVTVQAAADVFLAIPDGKGEGVRVRTASLGPVASRFLPLRTDHGVDPAGQLLAALRAQAAGEGGAVQLVLQAPTRSIRRRALAQAAGLRAGRGLQPSGSLQALSMVGAFLGEMVEVFKASSARGRRGVRSASRSLPADPFSLERARAIEAKASQPLLAATVRVGAWAPDRRRARGRLSGLLAAFGQYQDLGGLSRSTEPSCMYRLARCLPPVRPRLLLSCGEAAALVAIPEESAVAPLSFSEAPARRIAPVIDAPSRGLLLGRSDHSGFDRDVRIEPRALLQHTHVLGPTGRGKSTLLLNMTVEAIRSGDGRHRARPDR